MARGITGMYFEGTEKKFELCVATSTPSLRDLDPRLWVDVVRGARAEVISQIANEACHAFLLSESSLFVFDHRVVMITCGRTGLTGAVETLLAHLPSGAVRFFTYERKNEVFPHDQPTSFFDDVRRLGEFLPGRAYQFGDEDDHHLYLFHLDRPYEGADDEVTMEVLMHGLTPEILPAFAAGPGRSAGSVRQAARIEDVLPGFQVDDHLFEPSGYSVNAIRGPEYWTIHVTPDPTRSYASFETNCREVFQREDTLRRILDTFRPRAFDLVIFDPRGRTTVSLDRPYRLKSHVARRLAGFHVDFLSFYRPQDDVRQPIELAVP